MTFDQFVEVVRNLKVDRSGGEAKPYKPLLVASVVILIHKGEIQSPEILLDGGLKSVFYQLLGKLYPGRFETARIAMPYRYLETDGVWRLVPRHGESEGLLAARRRGGAEWQVLKHVKCAEMDGQVFDALAASFQNRFRVLQAIIQAHNLPRDRTGFLWDLLSTEEQAMPVPVAAESAAVTEKALEEHLETHWRTTEFASLGIELAQEAEHGLPCRQVLTPRNTIDLLGYRAIGREWWVFELKKGRTSDAVVGQVGRYMTWIGDQAKPGEKVKGAVIVGRVDENLKASVRSNERITLWQYDNEFKVRRVSPA